MRGRKLVMRAVKSLQGEEKCAVAREHQTKDSERGQGPVISLEDVQQQMTRRFGAQCGEDPGQPQTPHSRGALCSCLAGCWPT